jgi:hypothetical protein
MRSSVMKGLALVFIVTAGVLTAPSAAHASTCSTPAGPPRGYYVCEYGTTFVVWPDGHRQYFVVGTDYAVWDSYEFNPYSNQWSNWRYLGGTARSHVTAYRLSTSHIDLNVQGTDYLTYCKRWTSTEDWWPSQTGWAFGNDCY